MIEDTDRSRCLELIDEVDAAIARWGERFSLDLTLLGFEPLDTDDPTRPGENAVTEMVEALALKLGWFIGGIAEDTDREDLLEIAHGTIAAAWRVRRQSGPKVVQ